MDRFKLFITNFLVYGLGGVIGKIIPFIMLPIVTRLMPDTSYFGLNDISTIVVSFGSSLAVMGMYDAMFRMFFDHDSNKYKKSICSSTAAFSLVTSVIITAILLLFQTFFSNVFFGSSEYTGLVYLSALNILVGATNSIISAPTRIMNQRKVYLITNFLSPMISYAISVPLLIKGWYLYALPLASVVSSLSMELIFAFLNHQWFSLKLVDFKLIKQMLTIALPLMPNFLIYWLFNSADKLMIARMLGNDYAGIYAIGSKVGQMSQLIYTAFAGGWQYFAFSTMKDDDQVELTSKIFEYLGAITFIAGIFMMALSDLLFDILFTGDYRYGSIVAPYLFLAPLLLMLYQVGCNQFLIIKKTWPNLFILSFGAILNIVLNYFLIPIIGIEGAAVATLLGYTVSIAICVGVLQKMKLLKISKKFVKASMFMCVYFVIWRILKDRLMLLTIALAFIACACIVALYYNDLKNLVLKLRRR